MADSSDGLALDEFYQSFSAGMTLYYAGAPADSLYLIREGRVRLWKRANGVEHTTGVYGAGDLVGEEALVPGAHRTSTAEAMEPVTALVIESDVYRALTRKRPELADAVMTQLVERLRKAEGHAEGERVDDPILRILGTLLQALESSAGPSVSLSPVELSDRTGLDLELVEVVLGELHSRGYVQLGQRSVVVVDSAPLRGLQELLGLKEDARQSLRCR
jgi:CRP-like cAMP-binding protein